MVAEFAYTWGIGDTTRRKLEDIPLDVLLLVDERQGGRRCETCHETGRTTPPDEPLELDHRKPIVNGGDNHHSNLRWLCRAHNRARGARRDVPDVPAWERRQRGLPFPRAAS